MNFDARGRGGRGVLPAACGAIALAVASPAGAATWAGGGMTPTLRQVVATDATGEPKWPFGQEDVAGDGAGTFGRAEQAADVRTGYAAADGAKLWLRAYVSDADAVAGDLTLFAFVDRDRNAATGGPAAAPEIDPRLTAVASPGGFDRVVGVRGDGTFVDLWAWSAERAAYEPVPGARGRGAGEAGRDVDPIRIGADVHGYVQASVELAAVEVGAACEANVFFRTVNGAAAPGRPGDLDVGAFGPCVPADADGDKVPDVAVPGGCADDDQCPNGGACEGGKCLVAAPCVTTNDCPSGRECTADGRCVARGGGACTTNEQCGGRVCKAGACAACAPGGDECGAGRRCNADGTCGGADGPGAPSLGPGGRVEGGAFNCGGARGGAGAAGAGGVLAGLWAAAAAARGRGSRRRGGG
jgi:hypothetical protein